MVSDISYSHAPYYEKKNILLKVNGTWCCIQRKTWGIGPYAGVDYESSYLIVNSVVSYLPPLTRERGEMGKISPISWAHLYLSTNFQNTSTKKEGGGEGWELTSCLWIDFPGAWSSPCLSWLQPHCVAGFNSHNKMTMNLGSVTYENLFFLSLHL